MANKKDKLKKKAGKDSDKSRGMETVDILRARIPLMKNSVQFYVVFFSILTFWVVIVYLLGAIALSIPGAAGLVSMVRNIRSP